MDWLSCNNIFTSIIQEGQKRQVRFSTPLTRAVGEFAQNIKAVPEGRRSSFWTQYGGMVQKWAHEELFCFGYADQRFKFKKQTQNSGVEFMAQNLSSGTPIETIGQDTVEAVLQALYIAILDGHS
jgi:hypothetical protein